MNQKSLKALTGQIVCGASALLLSSSGFAPGQTAFAQQTAKISPRLEAKAPPPAPPMESRPAEPGAGTSPRPFGLTPYSIGQPTDEEQLYLEYLNRSRANPTAEGQLLANTTDPDVLSAYTQFGVDLVLMQNEFNTNPPVPPLAMNAQLMTAARLHSGDMFTNIYQGHNGTDGSTPGSRATAQGYPYQNLGENVFAAAVSVFYGHAGFDVDWGPPPAVGGMQNPPGHRNNIHSPVYREVGVGVVDGIHTNATSSVGPQLVTQDFGVQFSPKPFITGAVYYDLNGNGLYDIGEGIGGVKVDSPGSSYYAITADSGGYAIPATTNGNYTVTFSATGLTNRSTASIASQANVKVDFVPAYSPPVISGPNPAFLNQSNGYTFTPVGAASGYQWQQTQLLPYAYVEGAENGLANVTVVSSPGYSVLASDLVASGSYSFHLTHLVPEDQFLTLDAVLRPGATSQLTFAKLLGWSASDEVARAQITINGGASWQDLWSQAGSNGAGESTFSTVTVSLSAYAGQTVQVRFVYEFHSGSFFNCADMGCGLYLDNIAISNADQILSPVITTVASGTAFAFYPTNTSRYLLQVRARINSRTLPWSTGTIINVIAPPPVVDLANKPVVASGQIQVNFTVANYQAGMTLQLWKAADPAGTWTQDGAATLQTIVPNSQFRFTTAIGSASRFFYRVKVLY